MELDDDQVRRYARQIVLAQVGGVGQARLLEARVLVIGAGGLGSPLLLYLAAAGVGTLGVVDDDVVEVSNLQRQVIHRTAGLGQRKTRSAAQHLAELNPGIKVVEHDARLGPGNAREIARGYDLVADGSDSFETRALVQDTCLALGITLVSAAVQGLEGQLTTFKAHLGPPHPCLRCLFPDAPDGRALPSCAQGGVLGPVAGVVGCLQAVEVVKEILQLDAPSLSGTLLLYDSMACSIERVGFKRRPACGGRCERLSPDDFRA